VAELESVCAALMQSKPGPKFAVVAGTVTLTVVVIKIVVVSDRSFHFLHTVTGIVPVLQKPGANTEAVGFHLLALPLPSLGFCPFGIELAYPVAHY